MFLLQKLKYKILVHTKIQYLTILKEKMSYFLAPVPNINNKHWFIHTVPFYQLGFYSSQSTYDVFALKHVMVTLHINENINKTSASMKIQIKPHVSGNTNKTPC